MGAGRFRALSLSNGILLSSAIKLIEHKSIADNEKTEAINLMEPRRDAEETAIGKGS